MKNIRILAASLVLLLAVIGYAYANTLDLDNLFPDTQGQRGLQALRFNYDALKYYLLDDLGSYAFGRLDETDYNIPFVKLVPNPAGGYMPGIYMHPAVPQSTGKGSGVDPSIENVVFRYLIPADGYYNVTGSFTGADTGAKAVYVKLDAITAFSTPLVGTTQESFSLLNSFMLKGQHIYFGVGPGLAGEDFKDTTILNAVISTVPEPISAALFLLGGGAVIFGKIKRKIKDSRRG